MKNRFVPALLGLAVLLLSTSSARAQGCGWGFSWHASGSFGFTTNNGCAPSCPPGGGGGGGGLGPWYNYWPLDAHFQTPALPQYPYWPAPQTYNQGGYGPQQAPAQSPAVYGPGYQPYAVPSPTSAGQSYYNPYRTASYPSYWYGR